MSKIIQANADGTVKPPAEPKQLAFRAYPDGSFAKYTKDKSLLSEHYALCINTAEEGADPVLHQVALIKDPQLANIFCDGFNLLVAMRMRAALEKAKAEDKLTPINDEKDCVELARKSLEIGSHARADLPDTGGERV